MSRIVRTYAPGRTELAGNHTDHQGGKAVAAAVDCGITMTVSENGSMTAHVESAGFDPVEIDLTDLAPVDAERLTTAALVRGIVAGMAEAGIAVCGFDAQVTSDVPVGGGLSSSAAFELALGQALNLLFADGSLTGEQLALVGHAAECGWFGKPCGLMDQLAIALGGVQVMDFSGCTDGDTVPHCERIPIDWAQTGYALCLVDAHCDHSQYSDEYAQVTRDMNTVAQYFGAQVLSQVDEKQFFARFGDVRAELGDLCALRGLHYYQEMALVAKRVEALRTGNMDAFLDATVRSGASSAQYLQNVSVFGRAAQPAMAVLAAVDHVLGTRGACRIHGGGFGGTVQAFVPESDVEHFAAEVDALVGAGSCRCYSVVAEGARAEWL